MKAALTAALSRATRLQAGIAFWTIDSALLGPDLVRAIQHENGFVCVDLHPPTEVEPLAALARQGGRVHVYYEDIPTYTLGAQVTLTSADALAAAGWASPGRARFEPKADGVLGVGYGFRRSGAVGHAAGQFRHVHNEGGVFLAPGDGEFVLV